MFVPEVLKCQRIESRKKRALGKIQRLTDMRRRCEKLILGSRHTATLKDLTFDTCNLIFPFIYVGLMVIGSFTVDRRPSKLISNSKNASFAQFNSRRDLIGFNAP